MGLGHSSTIGDDEEVVSSGFADVGANVEQISAVGSHTTCALLGDGNVKCWGFNNYGQLGLGHIRTIGDSELPSSVPSLNLGEPVRQVAVAGDFVCALLASGRVKCWGSNNYGQLGLGHTELIGNDLGETSETFVAINLGARAVKISVGRGHSCALLEEGRLRCWGSSMAMVNWDMATLGILVTMSIHLRLGMCLLVNWF